MDFDGRFKADEFRENLRALNINLSEEEFKTLLQRTTRNTRRGNEFSFRPTSFCIGSTTNDGFFVGYRTSDLGDGPDPINPTKSLKTSVWFRFHPTELRIQFRLFCYPDCRNVLGLAPFEGRIPFRDVVPGKIQVRAQWDEDAADAKSPRGRIKTCLTIELRRPPDLNSHLPDRISGKNIVYDRIVTDKDFTDPAVKALDDGALSPFCSAKTIVKPGLWLTYRFRFVLSLRHYKLFWMCMVRFRKLGLRPDFGTPAPSPTVEMPMLTALPSLQDQPFELRYLIEVLISNHAVKLPDLPLLMNALSQRTNIEQKIYLLDALYINRLDKQFDLERQLQAIPVHHRARSFIPAHCVLVRRCVVTPLRVLVMPPQIETSNSVLRHFRAHQDRFIRLHFASENGPLDVSQTLISIDDMMSGEYGVFARIRQALYCGIQIAGRKYTFMCVGESQIKEQGCWMTAEYLPHFSRVIILGWMGDLRKERNIAKHAARHGLALSTSRAVDTEIIPREEEDIQSAADFLGVRFTFTDGAGLGTAAFLKACASTLGKTVGSSAMLSAVQIRIGGAKGVISNIASSGRVIQDNEILLRKSMVKFPSQNLCFDIPSRTLSVLKVANYSPAYLNRQAILLLESLGVATETLVELFVIAKSQIESIGSDSYGALYWLSVHFPIAEALKIGCGEDHLIQDMVRLVQCRLLSDLKWKARIQISEGAFLMGVPDKSRRLREGEVFCQIDNSVTGEKQIIKGRCIIFRNPCLHPGDVRNVDAIDVQELHCLHNVVVFPTQGRRDMPNMLAGGDLDGDFYTIIWDPRLLFPRNSEPADYTAPRPSLLNREVTEDDLKKWYLAYMMNNLLGVIDNAHLAWADQLDPMHDICLEIAGLHNIAVDFFKTGVAVDRSRLRLPSSWPDFMGQRDNGNGPYESTRALGRMFRLIDPDPTFEPVSSVSSFHPFDNITTPAIYLERAAKMKVEYDHDLLRLIKSHDLSSEVECLTGLTVKSHKKRMRRQRDYDRETAVAEAFDIIRAGYIQESLEFIQDHPWSSENTNSDDTTLWATACYKVSSVRATDEVSSWFEDENLALEDFPIDEDLGDDTVPVFDTAEQLSTLYSFGWLFRDELFKLMSANMNANTTL